VNAFADQLTNEVMSQLPIDTSVPDINAPLSLGGPGGSALAGSTFGFASAPLAFLGAAATVGEMTLSGVNAGTNGILYGLNFYGNQSVGVTNLGKAAGFFGTGVAIVNIGIDAYEYASGNPNMSGAQFSVNTGVALFGLSAGPLTALPAAGYFLINSIYPGGMWGFINDPRTDSLLMQPTRFDYQ
jgi:hypothetical protein